MAGTQFLYAPNRIIDANGVADGGSIYFYANGTTTLATIYSDSALTTPLTNPVVVGAGGLVPTVYLDPTVSYRVRTVADDGTINSDIDPYQFGISPDELAQIATDKAAAAASAVAAENSANDAASEAEDAVTAKTDAQTAKAAAETARDAAEDFRDEAEGFRDQTATNAGIFDDVTAAIAGTATGDYFAIPSASATGYVDLYKNVDDTVGNASLIDTLPNETALTNAVTAAAVGQAALGLPASVFGRPGTRLDFAGSQFGGTYVAGSLAGSTGGLATSVATFARATAAIERTGTGAFTSYSSGAGAYAKTASGQSRGIAIRPARTQLLDFGQKFDEAAHWTLTGVGTPTSGGTGPLGVDEYDVTVSAGSAAHSIRQTEAPTGTTSHVISFTLRTGTQTDFIVAMGSTPFNTGGNPLVYFNLANGSVSVASGAADDYGLIDHGGDVYTLWVAKVANSTSNSSLFLYPSSGTSTTWTAAGTETFTLISADFYAADVPVPPILTPSTSTVARNEDTMTLAATGAQRSFYIEVDNEEQVMPSNGHAFDWHDGTTSNRVRVYKSGDTWACRATSGGVDGTAVIGPDVGLNDKIALAFDAGTVRWAVNGVAQSAVTGAPSSGLTTVSIGHNISGGSQLNAVIANFETAAGAASSDELEEATGAAASGGGAETFDTTQLVVQSSSTLIRVFQHLNGGENNDWIGEDLEYRTFSANRSLGWARGKVARYTRIGEFTFTEVDEYVEAGAANDDSWKISGEAAGAFNAIMDSTLTPSTAHGWREALQTTPDAFYADGVAITPATAGNFTCGSFRGTQSSILLVPSTASGVAYDTTGKFADGEHEWAWGGGISEYRNRIAYTATVTVDKDGYLALYDIEPDFHDKAIYREGITTVATGTQTTISTVHPFMRREGDDIAVDFEVIGGFVTSAEVFVQNSDASSAKGKIYFQKLAVDTVRNSGDVDEAVVRHRWTAR